MSNQAQPYYPEKPFSLGLTDYKKYLETEEFIEFLEKLFGPTSTLGIPVLNGDNTFTGDNEFVGTTTFDDIIVDDTITFVDANTTIQRTSADNLTVNAKDELLLTSQESLRIKINTPISNASFPDSGTVTIEVADSAATGDGGDVVIVAGKAGNVTGSQTPGTAGLLTLVSGDGGNSASQPASNGGNLNITTGQGGTSSASRGGDGGLIAIQAGVGGNASTIGGDGGTLELTGGDGGAGSTDGNGGSILLQPGLAGGVTGANGAVAAINPTGTHSLILSPTNEPYGLMTKNLLKVVYDTATDPKAVGANVATKSVTIPANSYVTRAWYVVTQGFDSATSSATLAIGIETDDANGIETATQVIFLGAGLFNGDPIDTVATFTNITTDERNIIFTVAVEDLTVGKLTLFLEYITL